MSDTYEVTKDYRDLLDLGYPIIADPNHSNYELQENGNSNVIVQKVIVRKDKYIPFFVNKLGSGLSGATPNYMLIKEDSFTNIGGGLATVLRHYAKIPDSWFDYDTVDVLYYFGRYSSTIGINYDNGCRSQPVGFRSCGFLSGFHRRTMSVIAKATRYYVDEDTLDKYYDNNYILPNNGVREQWTYNDPTFPHAIFDNTYIDNFTLRGVFQRLPTHLFVSEPRAKVFTDNATDAVLAPDRIVVWQKGIYEITRFTGRINYTIPEASATGVAIYFSYRFDDTITEDQYDQIQININTAQQQSYEDIEQVTQFVWAFSENPQILIANGSIEAITSIANVGITNFITTGAVSTTFNRADSGNFLSVIWDNSSPVVNVQVAIGITDDPERLLQPPST